MNHIERGGNSELIDEQAEFETQLSEIQDFVRNKYESSQTKKEVVERFNDHNQEVMSYVNELALEEGLSPDQIRVVRLAIALHDVSKTDTDLLHHGFVGAKEAEKILKERNFPDEIIEKVVSAIERHMGPIPGFMAEEADKYNAKEKREKGDDGEQIDFPRPETEEGKIVYDADMLSLASEVGFEKILVLRSTTPYFIEQDKKTADNEKITQEKAAWRSALKSARDAVGSLYTESAKARGKILLEKANKKYFDKFNESAEPLGEFLEKAA